jgi:AcrR family transcriptional regulator
MRKGSKRLGRQEWIEAGLRAMAEGGADAVRIERLAGALRVTKGSFYWHFKDRGALFAALLDAWKEVATNAIIAQVQAQGGKATARLRALFTIAMQSDGRLDLAIRHWAARDRMARRALDQVDRLRFGYLEALFRELGFSKPEAVARSRLVYHALVGQFVMAEPATRRERLAEYLDIVFPMLVRKT